MCQTCDLIGRSDNPTTPGYWIQTIIDCAREEQVTVAEATEKVVSFIVDEAIPKIMEEDPNLKAAAEATGIVPSSVERVTTAIRRDGEHAAELLRIIAAAGSKMAKLADLLPVAAEQIARENGQ